MFCEYCNGITSHDPRCPNYIPPRTRHHCSVCDEGISNGEEYIMNDNGDYAHWECVPYTRDLVKFYGYRIEEMEYDDY